MYYYLVEAQQTAQAVDGEGGVSQQRGRTVHSRCHHGDCACTTYLKIISCEL